MSSESPLPEPMPPGRLTGYLKEDHRRLDELLRSASTDPHYIDAEAYGQFRAGLLRHIGMEEKILLPAMQRLNGGSPLPVAAKLRLDHGALAALLMPTPTPAIINTIHGILAEHNALEEGVGGLYELCDGLAGAEVEPLLAKLRAAPGVTVMPHNDSPAVMNTVRRTLERAGYTASL
ncbi:MAG TPA: hemerythrin domain-containing protein [Nitrospiraceae bacterium]|nr:hemerythrin domain-containing protein [Nitrospiraceae bacterium]